MRRLAYAAALAGLLVPGAVQRADCISSRKCTCTGSSAPIARFVEAFAAGQYDSSAIRHGVFLDATVLSLAYTDSIDSQGHRLPQFMRTKVVRRFRVDRAWTRAGEPEPPREIAFYTPAYSPCPLPAWKVGERYLVFAHSVSDTLRAFTPCGSIYPAKYTEAQDGFAALDSLLVRR